MTATFEAKGFRDIEKAFEGLGEPRDLRRIARAALRRGAAPIVDRAKELAPKDEGDLERSIKTGNPVSSARERRGQNIVSTHIGIDNSVDDRRRLQVYAPQQEFGDRNTQAQPYMRPALDERTQAAIDQVGQELWAGIEKRARFLARRSAKV